MLKKYIRVKIKMIIKYIWVWNDKVLMFVSLWLPVEQ